MASPSFRKRTPNVRCNSSSSSNASNENGMEMEYLSDNSASDVDAGHIIEDETGKVLFLNSIDSHGNSCPSQFNVLKKQFILNTVSGKRADNLDGSECYLSQRKGSKCLSKNAVLARKNRIKKKQYLESLEKKLHEISDENSQLKDQVKRNDETVQKLNKELKYLKSVLANSREISMLLKSVRQNTGLPVTSSLNSFTDAPEKKNDTSCLPFYYDFADDPFLSCGAFVAASPNVSESLISEKPIATTEENLTSDVGICLHVAQRKVSLEFCSTCNSNAATSWQDV